MNYKTIAYTLGWVLKIEAVIMLLPLVCGLCYGEHQMNIIFASCIIGIFLAGLFISFKKPQRRTMYAKEGFVIVALSWILISIFGAIPFWVSGYVPSFLDAVFETVSGFTTTGASVLSDVEILPKSLIFWRSFTHWIGGMGVLVFLVAILPLSGGRNMHLIKAESPGPSVSKLVPTVRATAKILYGIYLGLTMLQCVLLLFGGMTFFEAICTTFSTAGTGGFGIKNSSLGNFSPYCQVVVTIFMFLFSIDFSFFYLLLLGKLCSAFRLAEVRGFACIVVASILLVTLNCRELFSGFFEALRHGSFQVLSVVSTSGFSTTDFDLWPSFSKSILVLLMFVGACAGSTGGGIKVSRIIILLKSIFKEIRTAVHPRTTIKLTMNGRTIPHETVRSVNVFMASYLVIFAVSVLLISLDNFDFTTNFTAVVATINNVGPGLAAVGPTKNFAGYSDFSKVILSLDMLIGRLEIFPMLVLFSPRTWRK